MLDNSATEITSSPPPPMVAPALHRPEEQQCVHVSITRPDEAPGT